MKEVTDLNVHTQLKEFTVTILLMIMLIWFKLCIRYTGCVALMDWIY